MQMRQPLRGLSAQAAALALAVTCGVAVLAPASASAASDTIGVTLTGRILISLSA